MRDEASRRLCTDGEYLASARRLERAADEARKANLQVEEAICRFCATLECFNHAFFHGLPLSEPLKELLEATRTVKKTLIGHRRIEQEWSFIFAPMWCALAHIWSGVWNDGYRIGDYDSITTFRQAILRYDDLKNRYLSWWSVLEACHSFMTEGDNAGDHRNTLRHFLRCGGVPQFLMVTIQLVLVRMDSARGESVDGRVGGLRRLVEMSGWLRQVGAAAVREAALIELENDHFLGRTSPGHLSSTTS